MRCKEQHYKTMRTIGEEVVLEVKTTFGIAIIAFTVILVRPNHCYLLYAQDRIILGQEKAGGEEWVLSEPINLFGIKTVPNEYHKTVKS